MVGGEKVHELMGNPMREIGLVVGLKQLWVSREIDFSHSQLPISTAPLRTLCN